MKRTTAFAILWRVFIAVSTRTFFQPDEYYQSLEVAHRAVFGYGHLTWEWRASPPIRSVVFPSIYMPIYWSLKASGLDGGPLLVLAPKVLQGLLAAMTDIWVCELAKRVLGQKYSSTAFLLSITSFFHVLSLGRTVSNSVETSLTTLALAFWPWSKSRVDRSTVLALLVAAITCSIRPTNAIIWIFLFSELLCRVYMSKSSMIPLIKIASVIGCLTTLFLVAVDSVYFGTIIISPLNFLRTNLSSVALFYGRNPWHFYFTQGLPILCTTCLPFFFIGVIKSHSNGSSAEKRLLYLIWWTITIYSLAGHKEWRFIHPILPLIHVISSKAIVDLRHSYGGNLGFQAVRKLSARVYLYFLLFLGMIPGVYVMYFHSRAQISVMFFLRGLDPDTEIRSIGFLMPCHSTPSYAYLHRPQLAETGRMWALGCEPPLDGKSLTTYQDQSDVFYRSPITYLKEHFPPVVDPSFPPSPCPVTLPGSIIPEDEQWEHMWPSHLVFFGALIDNNAEVRKTLQSRGYVEVWYATNGWEEDYRRRGGVRVWAWEQRQET